MAGPTVQVTLAGDATSLDRALDRAGRAAIDAGRDFDRAGTEAKKFGRSMDGVNDTVDKSEGKFMGTADLLDGIGGAFGLPIDGAVGMARSLGDLASGMTSVVLPAVQGILVKLGLMTAATTAQTAATGTAATAQTGLNTAMSLNPIGAVVLAIGALVAAIVILVKNFDTVKRVAGEVWQVIQETWDKVLGFISGVGRRLAAAGAGLWDWVTAGLKSVLNIGIGMLEKFANAALDAVTAPVGILNKIPGVKNIIPDVPNIKIPRLAQGGIVNRPTLALIGEAGPEAVVPLGRGGGGGVTIVVQGHVLDGRDLADLVQSALLDKQRRAGRLGLT